MLGVVYIGGYGRSGSTILELEIARRLGGLGAGELSDFFEWATNGEPCSCGEMLQHCPIWGQVLAGTARIGTPIDLTDRLRRAEVGASRSSHDLSSLWFSVWTRVLAALDDQRIAAVVDSSKTTGGSRRALLMAELCGQLGLPFLFVHVSRDPRGVMYSAYKGGNRDMERGVASGSPITRSSRSAVGWIRGETRAMGYRGNRTIGRSVVVRYEEFCRDPGSVIDRVAGVAEQAGFCLGQRAENGHGIAGNRLRRIDPEPRVILDDEWRDGLPGPMRTVGLLLSGYRAWTTRSLLK